MSIDDFVGEGSGCFSITVILAVFAVLLYFSNPQMIAAARLQEDQEFYRRCESGDSTRFTRTEAEQCSAHLLAKGQK